MGLDRSIVTSDRMSALAEFQSQAVHGASVRTSHGSVENNPQWVLHARLLTDRGTRWPSLQVESGEGMEGWGRGRMGLPNQSTR